MDIAAFSRDQADRGKSVPVRLYRALVWSEKAFGLTLHSSSPQVRSQASPASEGIRPPPQAAVMVTVKMVADMESLISDAPTLPLRVYAGFNAALAHGVLRWSDLLWSNEIRLTADALVGLCWKMKRKQCQTPWAALRCGFTNTDWAARWLFQLGEAGLPGPDYTVRAVSKDGCRFTARIGGFNDGISMMRSLLIIAGMSAEDAVTYTMHSWRHLMPTAARQLRLTDSEQVEIGHWSVGSAMPRRYDAAACVTELTAKASITGAVARGWSIVPAGCVAVPPPPVPDAGLVCSLVPEPSRPVHSITIASSPSYPPPPHVPPGKRRKLTKPVVRTVETAIVDVGRHVSHVNTGKTHLWKDGRKSVCRGWECGTPDAPASTAVFCGMGVKIKDTPVTPQCRRCYAQNLSFLLHPTLVGEDTSLQSFADICSEPSPGQSSTNEEISDASVCFGEGAAVADDVISVDEHFIREDL